MFRVQTIGSLVALNVFISHETYANVHRSSLPTNHPKRGLLSRGLHAQSVSIPWFHGGSSEVASEPSANHDEKAASPIVFSQFALKLVQQWAPAAIAVVLLLFVCPHLSFDFCSCWHRLAFGGFLVSTVLVVLAVPQAVSVSGGALPNPNTKDMFHI